MTLTTEQLAALEAAFEKATKGEWDVDGDDRPGMEWNNHIVVVGTDNRVCFMAQNPDDNGPLEAAADFIALAHNLMPALIAAAKEARIIRAEMLAMQSAQDHLVNLARTAEAESDAAFTAGRKAGVGEAAGHLDKVADGMIARSRGGLGSMFADQSASDLKREATALRALIEEEKIDG